MYTYRKPKNAEHAIELVKLANVNVLWDICSPHNIEMSEKYFKLYAPIVFIYKNNNLIGAAHGKNNNRPTVIDLNDRDVTNTYNESVLAEINTEIKQLDLF